MRFDNRPLRFHLSTIYSICLVLVIASIGCNRGDQPELGVVTGKVTLEGEPLKNTEIAFIPDKGRPSYGQTDADGYYSLNYIRDIDGAKIGEHKLLIRSGKVDPEYLPPVMVSAGKNVIDIDCKRSTKKPPAKPANADDVDDEDATKG